MITLKQSPLFVHNILNTTHTAANFSLKYLSKNCMSEKLLKIFYKFSKYQKDFDKVEKVLKRFNRLWRFLMFQDYV